MLIILRIIASLTVLQYVQAAPAQNGRRQLSVDFIQNEAAANAVASGDELVSNGWEEESPVIDVIDDPRPVVSFAPQGSSTPVTVDASTTATELTAPTSTSVESIAVTDSGNADAVSNESTQSSEQPLRNKIRRTTKEKDAKLLLLIKDDKVILKNQGSTSGVLNIQRRDDNPTKQRQRRSVSPRNKKRDLKPARVTTVKYNAPNGKGAYEDNVEWFNVNDQRGKPAERWTSDYLQECYKRIDYKSESDGKNNKSFKNCMKNRKQRLNSSYPDNYVSW